MNLLIFTQIISIFLATCLQPEMGLAILLAVLLMLVWVHAIKDSRLRDSFRLFSVSAMSRSTTTTLMLIGICTLLTYVATHSWMITQLAHRLDTQHHATSPLLIAREGAQQGNVAGNQHRQDLQIQGCVVSQPQVRVNQRGQRVERFDMQASGHELVRRLRLSWYRPLTATPLTQGDCLVATVRVRPPRNYENGLAFDYEAFLMTQGIDAVGYVRKAKVVKDDDESVMGHARVQFASVLGVHRLSEVSKAWVQGLVLGDGQAFTERQWQQVRETGTLHLLVVSGLHLSMMMLLGWGVGVLLWRALLLVRWSSGQRGAVGALRSVPVVTALSVMALYVWLAGAGVPLIRAWVMAALALLLWQAPRRLNRSSVLLIAAWVVMMVNPLAWTQSGFVYSFAAVATLVFFFSGRRYPKWVLLGLPQWIILVTLMSIGAWMDTPVSLVHWLANLIAVPLVSLLMLPLAFACLTPLYSIADSLLVMLSQGFWWWITWCDQLDWPLLILPESAIALLMVLTLLWWLGSRVWGIAAAIGGLVLYSLGLGSHTSPAISLLDVGQGQSLIAVTPESALVIDTGAAYESGFSMAASVVGPALHKQGVRQLDAMIISHSDNDHAGGAQALMERFSPRQLWAGQPQALEVGLQARLDAFGFESCHDIDVLPERTGHERTEREQTEIVLDQDLSLRFFSVPQAARHDDNTHSCVVQLTWMQRWTVLIPGDIDAQAERALVEVYGDALQSDVLVAAHHGSKTSSSADFLTAVAPQEIWISAGWGNRFGHPHADVMARLLATKAKIRVTANEGRLYLEPDGRTRGQRRAAAKTDVYARGWPRWRQKDFSAIDHVLE
ncbi:MAG: DNA internalization-related competence protein ComEC/Rec2 [Pseudomonadota bacterium]|nr:DNA internalization-related competence protein ComEC/Rec2 [Pseudomonadota bacterium]